MNMADLHLCITYTNTDRALFKNKKQVLFTKWYDKWSFSLTVRLSGSLWWNTKLETVTVYHSRILGTTRVAVQLFVSMPWDNRPVNMSSHSASQHHRNCCIKFKTRAQLERCMGWPSHSNYNTLTSHLLSQYLTH